MALGLTGVAIFSVTLPATRFAVTVWDPVIIGLGRAVVAAAVAAVILIATRQPWPSRRQAALLGIVAVCVAFGFPLFTAIGMQTVPAAHGGVVLGVLPLATAAAGAVIGGERPTLGFWIVGLLGAASVVVFALWDGAGGLEWGDVWLFGAIVSAAVGYAVGGQLSREMSGWVVICWALVIGLPVLLPPVLYELPNLEMTGDWRIWAAFLYVALFSQLIGFFAWNKGLAVGGVARVSQTQLLQPFLTLLFAALLVGESIGARTVGFALLVVGLVWLGKRMPVEKPGDGR